ncbi:hypothetical protein [Roseomonas fluvialis]|uniref:Uncharacterized protein n=1 Tax=Roseomonas fluvialis TaxID=1750527 RepID=A0ABM7Y104_9PROT|nr:hypothetical protein [Roseomonas fluvialis]BDG71439.1 hypothetical protein Rmf_13680 [Roseomonas fluvialis]
MDILIRVLAWGVAMLAANLGAAYVWRTYFVPDWGGASRELAGDLSAFDERLQREIAAYNANLRVFSTPQTEALGASLSGRTVLTRFMMNRFVAPGERAELAARLRERHYREVCPRQGLALRAGYRFVYSYADIVGGEIRIVLSANDC